jgi:hypothetical protein
MRQRTRTSRDIRGMSFLLLLALIADLIILAASQMRQQSWALTVCHATINMCDHPVALLVAAVIFAGIYLIQR